MTIAMCYLSPEGVVLGADSTASAFVDPGGFHFFNHNQKLFELGKESSLGAITWGLASVGQISHRTIMAELSDDLAATKPTSLKDVADRWAAKFWGVYSTSPDLAPSFAACKVLAAKSPCDPKQATPTATARTEAEERQFSNLKLQLQVGFCIAGYVLPKRSCEAWEIIFDPLATKAPTPTPIPPLSHKFWGAPKVIQRLIFGADGDLRGLVLGSGKWSGTAQDLDDIIKKLKYDHVILPIRDAIDFVFSCIYSTVKALKFSNNSQICGGPIEIAVITTDRQFRWVRHKMWDVAIDEGML